MGTDSTKPSINLARAEDDKLRNKYQTEKAQNASDEADRTAREMVDVVTPSEQELGHKPGTGN